MHRLRLIRRDEQGFTIAFVTILILALITMAALVIDVGALHAERRELQNGADAAALAIAQQCAFGSCPANEKAEAETYAGSNATDSTTAIDGTPVHANPSPDVETVTVNVSTREPDGGTILPFRFAQAVLGQPGQTVRASATAGWGPPAGATVLSLAVSFCEFDGDTTDPDTGEKTFLEDDSHNIFIYRVASPEGDDPAGICLPPPLEAGFTWLGAREPGCVSTLAVGEWVPEDPNKRVRKGGQPDDCIAKLSSLAPPSDVLLPIFNETRGGIGTGSGEFRISGFAMFRVTGYRFSSSYRAPAVPPCRPTTTFPDRTCIRGGWLRTGDPVPGPVGGPNYGAVAFGLVA